MSEIVSLPRLVGAQEPAYRRPKRGSSGACSGKSPLLGHLGRAGARRRRPRVQSRGVVEQHFFGAYLYEQRRVGNAVGRRPSLLVEIAERHRRLVSPFQTGRPHLQHERRVLTRFTCYCAGLFTGDRNEAPESSPGICRLLAEGTG